MMNQFLGQNDHLWGANLFYDIINGHDWELSGNFPRVTVCDFQVKFIKFSENFRIFALVGKIRAKNWKAIRSNNFKPIAAEINLREFNNDRSNAA